MRYYLIFAVNFQMLNSDNSDFYLTGLEILHERELQLVTGF